MIAVISGATGLVGSVLLKKLLADPHYTEVVSVSRRASGVTDHKLKEVLTSDFSALSGLNEKLKGDVYFCCLGTTIKTAGSQEKFRAVDYGAVMEFGKIAKSHNAESFILVSAQGANPQSKIYYNKVKGEVETALRNLGLKRLVIMHPSLLMGERQEFRVGEKIASVVAKGLAPILPVKFKKMAMTDVNELATRMLMESKLKKSGLSVISAQNI